MFSCFLGCTTWYNTMSVPLSAGDTIAIQAGAVFLQATLVSFGATFVPAPENDDIADAIPFRQDSSKMLEMYPRDILLNQILG